MICILIYLIYSVTGSDGSGKMRYLLFLREVVYIVFFQIGCLRKLEGGSLGELRIVEKWKCFIRSVKNLTICKLYFSIVV